MNCMDGKDGDRMDADSCGIEDNPPVGDNLDGAADVDGLGGLIGPSVWHRSIDGNRMVAIRQGLEVSGAVFASQCGHSQQFQQQLERPGVHEISADKAAAIVTAISFYK